MYGDELPMDDKSQTMGDKGENMANNSVVKGDKITGHER